MPPHPEQATFRLPASALFIPIVLFLVTTPLASASTWTLPLYALPLYALVYVFWTRTVADSRTITAYQPYGRRRIPWADLDGFEFHGPRWAIAVTHDGRRTRLPMVRPRDLRRLAAVSGGRLYLGEDAVADAENAADSATTVVEAAAENAADSATAQVDPAVEPSQPPALGPGVATNGGRREPD